MKIVQFVEAFGAGVYTYVKDLCNYIVENYPKDTEVYLIYSPNRDEFDHHIFYKEINSKVNLIEIKMNREINIGNDLSIIKQTRNILKKIKPDIIHLHSSKSSVLGRIAAFKIIPNNKIFYSPHGYSFVQKNISDTKKILFKTIEKTMPLLFGGITIASGYTEFQISKSYGKSVLINNGVDLNLPSLLFKKNTNSKLTIGTIGRLSFQKNPNLFNQLAQNLPEYNFIWIGDGELKHILTSPNIEITGWIKTREELLQKINQLDIYTQVSLWEGLPISILEAMAMKKPLVVTNVVGNKDTVIEKYNGFIFNTINEALDAFKKLENNSIRNDMSENSYLFCNSDFNKVKNLEKIYNLYLS